MDKGYKMLTAVGAAAILSGAGIAALCAYREEKSTVARYSVVYDFVSYMRKRIETGKTPLSDIISDFSESSEEAKKYFGKASPDNLLGTLQEICPEIKQTLKKSLDTVFDIPKDAVGACRELESFCLEKLNYYSESFEKRKKSIIILPFAAGVMLLILLI